MASVVPTRKADAPASRSVHRARGGRRAAGGTAAAAAHAGAGRRDPAGGAGTDYGRRARHGPAVRHPAHRGSHAVGELGALAGPGPAARLLRRRPRRCRGVEPLPAVPPVPRSGTALPPAPTCASSGSARPGTGWRRVRRSPRSPSRPGSPTGATSPAGSVGPTGSPRASTSKAGASRRPGLDAGQFGDRHPGPHAQDGLGSRCWPWMWWPWGSWGMAICLRTGACHPDRDRARMPSLPAATNAAASSVAVSSAAPITHHQKKMNTDATNSPSPRPPTKAPAQANRGRRLRAASNRCRRCQRPPASSPTPASKGTSATTSTRDKPCPGLIGISSGPSRLAGTTNRSNARANKLPHPSSHLIPALGAATTSPSPQPSSHDPAGSPPV
jgi:hypothetical protein